MIDTAGSAKLRVLGIPGSLRAASFNTALLRACVELAPSRLEIAIYDRLRDIPPYDQDRDAREKVEAVEDLKSRIASADALIFATPEYNFGIPGVLKNAIDWASRPPATTPLKNKPASIIGATPGRGGTIRAQSALRQVFVFTQTIAMLQPEVFVTAASEKFDQDGRLTDEPTRAVLKKHLDAFAEWIERVRLPLPAR